MKGVLRRKLRTLRQQSVRTMLMVAPAWLMLGLFRALILSIPLKRLAPLFGEDSGVTPWLPLATSAQIRRAREVKSAIAIAANYSPWTSNCYPQALAARLLLRFCRVPHVLFFGLARANDGAGIDAHAWVMSGPVPVTGRTSFGRYTVVRIFASAPAIGARAL